MKRLLKNLLWLLTAQGRAKRMLFSVKLGVGDIAIDCGANIGDITQHLQKNGATVYCFEPNPYAFKALKKRFLANPKVHCFEKGVFDRNDRVKLSFHELSDSDELYWSTGSSMLDFKGNILKDKYTTIQVIDLCAFIRTLHSRVRLLKMDVEGAECPILKKLIETGLINRIDYLFVETHDRKIPELQPETEEIRRLVKFNNLLNVNLHWE